MKLLASNYFNNNYEFFNELRNITHAFFCLFFPFFLNSLPNFLKRNAHIGEFKKSVCLSYEIEKNAKWKDFKADKKAGFNRTDCLLLYVYRMASR